MTASVYQVTWKTFGFLSLQSLINDITCFGNEDEHGTTRAKGICNDNFTICLLITIEFRAKILVFKIFHREPVFSSF